MGLPNLYNAFGLLGDRDRQPQSGDSPAFPVPVVGVFG